VSATTPGAGGPWANILEVATAIVSTMSWEETLNKIAEKMGSAMFAWSAGINSFDQERRLVTYEAYWCEGGSTEEDLAYIGNISSLDDRTDFKPIIEGRELVEWHVDDPGLSESDRELMKRWGLKSSLDAPLIYNDEVIGSAQIQETRYARKFTPIERSIFVQLCELASIGVHNAQENRARLETERRFAALAEHGARRGAAQ
jgi:GAF domain-containing protein